jgi:hypothetical protein
VHQLPLAGDELDLLREEQASTPVEGPERERRRLVRGPEPGLLDPADEPAPGLDAKAVTSEQVVSNGSSHVCRIPVFAVEER